MVRPAIVTPALSPALLLAGALLVMGCVGPLPIDNRPCDCSAGYVCCPNNMCMPVGEGCEDLHVSVAPPVRSGPWPQVRQGQTIMLVVTGKDLTNVGNMQLGDIAVRAPANATNGALTMPVTIWNGTALGRKELSFTTHDGRTWRRGTGVTVSPVAVSVMGDNANLGTMDSPLRTLEEAFRWVGPGDIIQVMSDTPQLGPAAVGNVLRIPNGVTVQGSPRATGKPAPDHVAPASTLTGRIQIERQAIIRDLTLGAGIEMQASGSSLTLENVQTLPDREVGVVVDPQAVQSTVVVTGPFTRMVSTYSPLLQIRGAGANVRVVEGASVKNLSNEKEAIWINSEEANIEIDHAFVGSGAVNAVMAFARSFVTVRAAVLEGCLNLMGPQSRGEIVNTEFNLSSPGNAGGVNFGGGHLSITGSQFHVGAIWVQTPLDGDVVVRHSQFRDYLAPPVTVASGILDLGTVDDPGGNSFQPAAGASGQPVAIVVTAPTGKAEVYMRETTIGGVSPPPGTYMGPIPSGPFFLIDNMVPVYSY